MKKVLIIVAAVIAIPLIVALFVNGDYSVEREIVVNKPPQEVFNYIKYLKNQANYSKWEQMDPTQKKEYRGTDGTVGFVSAWDSQRDSVGKGEMTIVAVKEGERLDMDLHFMKPFEARTKTYMTTTAVSDMQTKVVWGFSGKMPYPMNLMLLFNDMRSMIGNDLQAGLTNLKTVLEP